MSLTVRHLTPGLGVLPRDISVDACSGLVGVAIGTAQAQSDLGHRAQVFGWNPRAETSSWMIESVEAYATRGWDWAKVVNYDFRVTLPLLALSSRIGSVDVLHAYTDPHLLMFPKARTRLFHLQTPVPDRPARTYSRLVNRADAVVCCSSFIRDQFLENIAYPEHRVFQVTNGIDERRFDDANGTVLRAEWGVDPETPVLLFAGALVQEKGLLYLLKAARELQNRFEFQIVVAGSAALWLTPDFSDDGENGRYTRMVREAAEGLPVRWLGSVSVDQMPRVHAAADLFVCPSAWDEPFGMVACEAMAAGKPVIASRRGGLPEIVVDGETGLLVPSEDVAALTFALARLLEDRNLAARMGQKGKERSRRFAWTRIAAQLNSIYEELGALPRVHTSQAPGSTVQ
jgi:glycosyltransferase involved in cell wall biosynthesis